MKTYIISITAFISGVLTSASIGVNKYHDGYGAGYNEGFVKGQTEVTEDARTEGYHAAIEDMKYCFKQD